MTTDDKNEKTPSAPGAFDSIEDPTAADHLIEPENPLDSITIDDLSDRLRTAVERAGWTSLTPVQQRAIPYLMADRDIMIQSRTGSGKTGAFILPLLDKLDETYPHCQALVLVPTRELAQQVTREATMLSGDTGLRITAVYGGVGYGPQLDAFRQGAHLVIGTPGRILDHLIRGSLDLKHLRVLIFDEADRMLSMGFYPDMKEIRSYIPRRRSGFMFSATYPYSVRRLAGQFLDNPDFLSLSRDVVHVTETDHYFYEVPSMDKDRALVRIIEVENPESAIIFCNTKMRVNYVATVLQRFGYDADQLTADLSQAARDKVLSRLRDHSLRFLVATDLAGRGIDIVHLSHVINYEFPEDHESYIHRTGRTGRAGASGIAFSLVSYSEKSNLQKVAKRYTIPLEEKTLPTDDEVAAIISERLTALLEARLRSRDRVQVERMQRLIPLARSLGESEDELQILAMVLDDYYQASLQSQPDTAADAPSSRESSSSSGSSRSSGSSESSRGGRRRRPRRRRNS